MCFTVLVRFQRVYLSKNRLYKARTFTEKYLKLNELARFSLVDAFREVCAPVLFPLTCCLNLDML